MKKYLVLLATILTISNSNALMINDGMLIDDMCFSISKEDFSVYDSCLLLASSSSAPTYLIDSEKTTIDQDEAMAKLVEERLVKPESALMSQRVADYYGVSVSVIQEIVADLYNSGEQVTPAGIEELL